jgi:predicted nucleic acid-binding protein
MKAFVDTNVLMDVLGERKPFFDDAMSILSLAESGRLDACISAISFNTCWYLTRKHSRRAVADRNIRLLRDVFTTVDLTSQVLIQAIDAGFADFEDAIQFHSAIRSGASCIITRNADHFPREPLSILSPPDFLAHHSLK